MALFEPDGTYAGYTLPQGLGDFEAAEVANPHQVSGRHCSSHELDGATTGGTGTSGPIQWDAQTWLYAPAGSISPAAPEHPPGTDGNSDFEPDHSGVGRRHQPVDRDLFFGGQTTVPVTVRSVIPIGPAGGTFSGVLTGGNGRAGAPAERTRTFSRYRRAERPGRQRGVGQRPGRRSR